MSVVYTMLGTRMGSAAALPVHTDARGVTIDEAVGFYEHVYASHDIHIGQAAAEGFSWRYRAVGDDALTVGTSAVAARRWGTINPRRDYILAWATGAGITLDTASRSPIQMLPGVPTLYPAGRDFMFEALPTTQHLLRFDGLFLEAIAAATHRTLPGPLHFTANPLPADLQRLQRTIAAAAADLLDATTDRPRRTMLNLRVAEAVIDAFAGAPVIDVVLPDGPATMRLAQEWMVANAHRPITVTNVSDAVGIAVRSVQASFQKHAGMTPMTFLRQVRLYRARAELIAADPANTAVADIARRWGFFHLGRFAAAYAAEFAELPSATLRQRHH